MERGRARDLVVVIGTYPTGPRNSVTDVQGVRVGHATVVRDPGADGAGAVRTGVTTVMVSLTASNTTTIVGRTSTASGIPIASGLGCGSSSISRTMS